MTQFGAAGGREVTVSLLLTNSAWAMQPEPTSTSQGQEAPSDSGPRPQGAPSAWQSAQPMVFLLVMFGIFYFLMIRPQQKRQRETDSMLKALRRGDKVRTSGGIRGEIIDLTDSEVTLLIADKVKINVLRSHVAGRIGVEGTSAEASRDTGTKDAGREPGKEKS